MGVAQMQSQIGPHNATIVLTPSTQNARRHRRAFRNRGSKVDQAATVTTPSAGSRRT